MFCQGQILIWQKIKEKNVQLYFYLLLQLTRPYFNLYYYYWDEHFATLKKNYSIPNSSTKKTFKKKTIKHRPCNAKLSMAMVMAWYFSPASPNTIHIAMTRIPSIQHSTDMNKSNQLKFFQIKPEQTICLWLQTKKKSKLYHQKYLKFCLFVRYVPKLTNERPCLKSTCRVTEKGEK